MITSCFLLLFPKLFPKESFMINCKNPAPCLRYNGTEGCMTTNTWFDGCN